MGGVITILLNGTQVNETVGDQTGRLYGIENGKEDSTVYFRSITFTPNFN